MDTRTTFKVRVWSTRPLQRAQGTHYQVRWFLDGREYNETFSKSKAADSFRSVLVAAVGKGEAFAFVTGLPLSHPKTVVALTPPAVPVQTVLELATSFVDRKWKEAAPTYRVDIAKAMTAVTSAMLADRLPAGVSESGVRSALRNWQFAGSRRVEAPADVAKIVAWVATNTRPIRDLDDSHAFEIFFGRVTSKLDGKPMAASSYKRYRAILNSFLSYCVRLKQLETHPLKDLEITDTKASRSVKAIIPVDKRRLPDVATAEALLKAVEHTSRNGETQALAMEVMYRVGLRPEEVTALLVENVISPGATGEWGELTFEESAPETDVQWTDDGTRRQRRGLKGRAAKAARTVPVYPSLATKLVAYIAKRKLKPKDRLFSGYRGGELNYRVLDKALKRAREVAMPGQVESSLAKTLYDWRHLCLTNWINRGIPPATVAKWAGNSVTVLMATYVNVIDGEASLRSRLEGMYDLPAEGQPEDPDAGVPQKSS